MVEPRLSTETRSCLALSPRTYKIVLKRHVRIARCGALAATRHFERMVVRVIATWRMVCVF
jgi:hypothetical protein